ncbi:hypothetical protein CAPTEDRAFT_219957 [Capitella teleta]|uniref:Phosphodiesterase n=1 Tax=Capitella teleta TaxID=283909 RepID=R7TD81_CAPTE|nr:hypothetical protein CAPTEDRAFT_219957 [Capitella teleta]|eukprot:ELT89026.1 hypothetical protein CAPTEDRAFT_219957 [Capitella teleta]
MATDRSAVPPALCVYDILPPADDVDFVRRFTVPVADWRRWKEGRLSQRILHDETPTSSYESAIIGEAHGLISDMLADSSLPPHIVSGLRSVSNLLKPPENHAPSHKPKVSPLVSLTEATNYGSDSEDLPYTGERPSSLPKRLRRSLPPSLIRRMSTSTWTTTTSATGMPTLELEPCRTRSSSFRHSRESTPGSSPTGSRSNSPSPSSPTTISLTIPKSRSFSATSIGAHAGTAAAQKRPQRERKGYYLANPAQTDNATGTTPSPVNKIDKCLSPLIKGEAEMKDLGGSSKVLTSPVTKDLQTSLLSKRLNITSDYESSDSPSSSDHSDNVNAAEDARPIKLNKTELSYHNERKCATQEEELEADSVDGAEVETKALVKPQDIEHYDSAACLTDKERSQLIMPFNPEELKNYELLDTQNLSVWDYPIFDLAEQTQDTIVSRVAYKLFQETGLFETFRIPLPEFLTYFHALELGYRDKPYHNRIHATDVLHGVYYLTTQAIPGFQYVNPEGDVFQKLCNTDSGERQSVRSCCRPSFTADDTYGILGGNFPPLELMALFTAAAMHDYDHPGRTNAFLVTTHAPLAVLYNDRSVLENHHAASVWRLFMSSPRFNWLIHLDKAEFKRFRFLIVEAILATDLKRHFEILAEFNAKVNDDDAPGIDWTMEPDRLMVANMVIKMADINGPCKKRDLHFSWTEKISEEFYEQGDEEASLGLTISPYMNRKHPQLAKLQESFINHLVAPLCNAIAAAGLLPGTWVDDESEAEGLSDTDKEACKDTDDEEIECEIADKDHKYCGKKIHCALTKNLKNNHDMWVAVLKHEEAQKGRETTIEDLRKSRLSEKSEMETIKEEDTPPNSAASTKDDGSPYSSALQRAISSQREALAAQAKKHSPPPAVLNNSDSQPSECCSSSVFCELPLKHFFNQADTPYFFKWVGPFFNLYRAILVKLSTKY